MFGWYICAIFFLQLLGVGMVHAEMTLEEKVGQVLMVHFHGQEANEEARVLIQDLHVGGIVYYEQANGLRSPEQVRNLSAGLQSLNKKNGAPLLIAVDQEGGIVNRLNWGFTHFPGNRALAMTGDPGLAEQAAWVTAQELLAVGVNLNLAPVVDVNSQPKNPVIGIRSFGETAEAVLTYGERALRGYKRGGVLTCLKHYPGHGGVEIDSHEALPVIDKSLEDLKHLELVPFYQLSSLADVVMTGHLVATSLDDKNCTTLSPTALNFLRDQIGFQGVILSDSLIMDGVLNPCSSLEEACIEALNAGCDMLLLGGKLLSGTRAGFKLNLESIQKVHQTVVEAVQNGKVDKIRLEGAVERILELKKKILPPKGEVSEGFNALTHKIASLALKVSGRNPQITPLKGKNIVIFTPNVTKKSIIDKAPFPSVSYFVYNGFNSEEAVERALKGEFLIIVSYDAWKNGSEISCIQSILQTQKPCALVVLKDPLDASLFPEADLILTTFSPTAPSIKAVWDYLSLRDVQFSVSKTRTSR